MEGGRNTLLSMYVKQSGHMCSIFLFCAECMRTILVRPLEHNRSLQTQFHAFFQKLKILGPVVVCIHCSPGAYCSSKPTEGWGGECIKYLILYSHLSCMVARLQETPSQPHLLLFKPLCSPFHIK